MDECDQRQTQGLIGQVSNRFEFMVAEWLIIKNKVGLSMAGGI